jgi:2-dehydro-3-deoxygluconokinase
MGELCAADGQELYRLDAAGDSFNTAVYLSRSGLSVEYLSCLGDDHVSSKIMSRIREEGIGCNRVRILPGRKAGIYLVRNDPSGERHFTYWRENSAARSLFAQPCNPLGINSFYFTGITLAICREGIDNLLQSLAEMKQEGCAILFDPNYRPALWDDREQARNLVRQVLPFCDMVFPTLEDEQLLWAVDNVHACRDFYMETGVGEVVVKAPDLTAHAWHMSDYASRVAKRVEPLDTTGAGDAFNAGYLSVRLRGGAMEMALGEAQALAARVVLNQGAILPAYH